MPNDLEQRIAQLEAIVSGGGISFTVAEAGDTAFVLLCVVFIMLMQLGFAMLECGSVRENNVVTTYAKNFLDVIVASLISALWAYALAYDEVILSEASPAFALNFSMFVSFQAASSTIVSGAVAERITTSAYLCICTLLCGFVYPLHVRWSWAEGGFLRDLGFHDFAGSGVVHVTGGAAALAAAHILGPRSDRWDPTLAGDFVPSNVPKVLSTFSGAGSCIQQATNGQVATPPMHGPTNAAAKWHPVVSSVAVQVWPDAHSFPAAAATCSSPTTNRGSATFQ